MRQGGTCRLAGTSQLVFLALFSYLTVTVGAVIQEAPPFLSRG